MGAAAFPCWGWNRHGEPRAVSVPGLWGGRSGGDPRPPSSLPPLSRLMNKLQPNAVRKINRSAQNWHQVGARAAPGRRRAAAVPAGP